MQTDSLVTGAPLQPTKQPVCPMAQPQTRVDVLYGCQQFSLHQRPGHILYGCFFSRKVDFRLQHAAHPFQGCFHPCCSEVAEHPVGAHGQPPCLAH